MKRFIFFIALLYCCSGWSQTQEKPIYYADVNGYVISKDTFVSKIRDANNKLKHLSILFENDTCYIRKLVNRKNFGKLNSTQKQSLFSILNGNTDLIQEKYVVILYHPGRDSCNGGRFYSNGIKNNIYTRNYKKKVDKKYHSKTYWFHKKDKSIDFESINYINWQLDKDEVIEKLFFKHHYQCNSFVVINNSNGNYISILGESGLPSVIEVLEEMIEHNK